MLLEKMNGIDEITKNMIKGGRLTYGVFGG